MVNLRSTCAKASVGASVDALVDEMVSTSNVNGGRLRPVGIGLYFYSWFSRAKLATSTNHIIHRLPRMEFVATVDNPAGVDKHPSVLENRLRLRENSKSKWSTCAPPALKLRLELRWMLRRMLRMSFDGALTLSRDPYNFTMKLRNRNALLEPRFNNFHVIEQALLTEVSLHGDRSKS